MAEREFDERKQVSLWSTDKWDKFTSTVHDFLEEKKIPTFYQRKSIKWGQSIADSLNRAIRECCYAVVILCPELLKGQGDVAVRSLINVLLNQAQENRICFLPALTLGVTPDLLKREWPLVSSYESLTINDKSPKELAQTIAERVCRKSGSHEADSPVADDWLDLLVPNFFGRENIISKFLDNFVASRFLSIYGPPGIGKSQLAGRVACKARINFSGNPWRFLYVDANHINTERDIIIAMLEKLSLLRNVYDYLSISKSGEAVEPVQQLRCTIAHYEWLCVILDNCDHLMSVQKRGQPPSFVTLLLKLTDMAPKHFKFMITSMQSLEPYMDRSKLYEVKLGPLSDQMSHELLLSYARSEGDEFFTDHFLSAVSRDVCYKTPMLLKMVGRLLRSELRASTRTENTLLSQLQRNILDYLGGGDKDKIMYCFQKVYERLSVSVQESLCCLALFTVSFTKTEGAAILGIADEDEFAGKFLFELIDFGFVHKIISDSKQTEAFGIQGVVRDFLAKEFGLKWDERTGERNNPRFKEAVVRFWEMQLELCLQAQKSYETDPYTSIALLLKCRANIKVLLDIGSFAESKSVFRRCVKLARSGYRKSLLRTCLPAQCRRALYQLCYDTAVKQGKRKDAVETEMLLCLANVAMEEGDFSAARTSLKKRSSSQTLAIDLELKLRYDVAKSRVDMHFRKSDDAAWKRLHRVLTRGESAAAAAAVRSEALMHLGIAHGRRNNHKEAAESFTKALAAMESLSPLHPDKSNLLLRLGHSLYCLEKYKDSLENYDQVLDQQARLLYDVSSMALTYYQRGICYAASSEFDNDRALRDFSKAIELLDGTVKHPLVTLTKHACAKVRFADGVNQLVHDTQNSASARFREAKNYFQKTEPSGEFREVISTEKKILTIFLDSFLADEKEYYQKMLKKDEIELENFWHSPKSSFVVSFVKVVKTGISSRKELLAAAKEIKSQIYYHSYVGCKMRDVTVAPLCGSNSEDTSDEESPAESSKWSGYEDSGSSGECNWSVSDNDSIARDLLNTDEPASFDTGSPARSGPSTGQHMLPQSFSSDIFTCYDTEISDQPRLATVARSPNAVLETDAEVDHENLPATVGQCLDDTLLMETTQDNRDGEQNGTAAS